MSWNFLKFSYIIEPSFLSLKSFVCFLILSNIDRPVCPLYFCNHSLHSIWYMQPRAYTFVHNLHLFQPQPWRLNGFIWWSSPFTTLPIFSNTLTIILCFLQHFSISHIISSSITSMKRMPCLCVYHLDFFVFFIFRNSLYSSSLFWYILFVSA